MEEVWGVKMKIRILHLDRYDQNPSLTIEVSVPNKLICLSGVSGSGKSTFAATLSNFVVSADDFFIKEGKYNFDVRLLPKAHGACFRSCISYLAQSFETVVVDNTSTNVEDISPYALVATAFGYDFESVINHVDILDLPKCVNRNKHGTPYETILRQYTNLMDMSKKKLRWVTTRRLAEF